MPVGEQDRRISGVMESQGSRLRDFIRRRVADPEDVEDVFQDVFYELVRANRLLVPIEHVTGWLFQVARNRIADLFRKTRPETLDDGLEELLPSPGDGPDALLERRALLEELSRALAELPPEQRAVFVAHELEGRSFKEIAAESGANLNTLLSRKRYAVLRLRERLQSVHDALPKR